MIVDALVWPGGEAAARAADDDVAYVLAGQPQGAAAPGAGLRQGATAAAGAAAGVEQGDATASDAGAALGWLAHVAPVADPGAATEAVAAASEAPGCAGVLIDPADAGAVRAAGRVAEAAAGAGLPLVATPPLGAAEPLLAARLAARVPGLRVLLIGALRDVAGVSVPDIRHALEQADGLALATTGVYRLDLLRAIAVEFGPQRLLYASAAPRFDPRFELQRVRRLGLPGTAEAAVLGGNARRWLTPAR